MGGKIWTAEEEEVFWNQIVPQSYHRLGADRTANPGRDWAALGRDMRHAMPQYYDARGEEIPRLYSAQSLYEHWDRNVHVGPSRYARQYVEAYRAQAATDGTPIVRRPHRAKKSLAKVPADADETDVEDENDLGADTSIDSPVAPRSSQQQATAQDQENLGDNSNDEDEDEAPRPVKRRRVGNQRVTLDQNHPRLARRREELLRLACEEQQASSDPTVADGLPPPVARQPGFGTGIEDRNVVMPPMTYGEFEDRVNRQVEARLTQILADQRARTLRDIDDRMAEHLASFSTTLAGGVRATEAGVRRSQPAVHTTTAARRPLPAARYSPPTTRPAFLTTPSGIPRIYPPSNNPSIGNPVGMSTPAQSLMPATSTTPVQQPANSTAGVTLTIPSPDGSPEAPIQVPSSSDEEADDKNGKGKKEGNGD